MNCDQAHDLMHDLLDESIAAETTDRLNKHLSVCDECRVRFEQLLELDRGLDDLRVLTDLPNERVHSPTPIFRVHRVTRAAAAIALLIGGGLLVRTALRFDDAIPDAPFSPPVVIATPVVQLTDVSADRYLAEAAESGDPNVHIVWLHPAIGRVQEVANEPSSRSTPQDTRPGALLAVSPMASFRG